MPWHRNLLISIGAYWLSHYPVALMAFFFFKLSNGIIYGDSILAAIAMGMMDSMGRAVCAALGAAIVMLSVGGAKPQRWALVVALLYVIASPPHHDWVRPPTTWDRVSQIADLLWPAIVCIAVASLISRRHNSQLATRNDGPETIKQTTGRKRHWGRLVWVGITNAAVGIFGVTVLIGIRKEFSSLPLLLSTNAHTVLVIAFAAIGLLLEALNRRMAAFANCGLWLAIVMKSFEGLTLAGVPFLPLLILAVDCVWYVIPALARRNQSWTEISVRIGKR